MTDTIIVAVIALIGTLAGSFFANSKTTAVMEEKLRDVKEDINSLEKKVEKHNNLVERMAVVERDLKTAFNVIDEIKKKGA